MKIIQCIADIEELKSRSTIPLPYLNIIETEFFEWFEAEGNGEPIIAFRLPTHSCIYHLEDEQDTSFIANQILKIEFVEYETAADRKYFRLGLMNEHEMSLVFFLEGTIEQRMEECLKR
ncbi:hypothetical protein [Cytobacillus firmus]|uniref:hypothetical protein n=1 Tax=Cytobacillus firmus TaxID=1399 RepID=UPI0018CF3A70|nr:hypothetical protein [Cytobacillus firmus]MBG9550261.1 hypothetical protein [Cytobacillus firmus]MBG9602043.1 hypothetical protein [Cytobacillus firmus]MED1942954.1 hypothetical protein [Cytobacillus firmus]